LCLGYPFHPPGKPENLQTAHLETLQTPTLILQGSRDPMGTKEAVEQYALSPAVKIHWAEDGNHDLAPRKMSGRTTEQNWQEATQAIVDFIEAL
jgi:predicted alpha/beta-hydrolase family hydrolase